MIGESHIYTRIVSADEYRAAGVSRRSRSLIHKNIDPALHNPLGAMSGSTSFVQMGAYIDPTAMADLSPVSESDEMAVSMTPEERKKAKKEAKAKAKEEAKRQKQEKKAQEKAKKEKAK
jgi:hypothetical protein